MLDIKFIQNSSHEDLESYLLKNPSEKDRLLDDGESSCLHFAAWGGNERLIKFLVEKLEDNVSKSSVEGTTPLHLAASSHSPNSLKVVISLVKYGADINAIDNDGNSPLHMAVFADNQEIVRYLLDSGAQKEISDNDGNTPFDLAVSEQLTDMIRVLS